MLEHLDLNPPYQRGSVWTLDQRIALVKSWVMGVPVPAVILNDRSWGGWTGEKPEDTNVIWAVVDGKQRIETAVAWFKGDLAVPASWFPSDRVEQATPTSDGQYVTCNGLTLPGRRLMAHSAMMPCIEAKLPDVPAEAELYLLVNGGGTGQSADDMARAAQVAVAGRGRSAPPRLSALRQAADRQQPPGSRRTLLRESPGRASSACR